MPLLEDALAKDEMQEVKRVFLVVHEEGIAGQTHTLWDVNRKWPCGMWRRCYYIHDSAFLDPTAILDRMRRVIFISRIRIYIMSISLGSSGFQESRVRVVIRLWTHVCH